MTIERLEWGLTGAVPAGSTAAWGARLIVTQDGYVDLVPDRMGAVGQDKDTFLALLDEAFPVTRLRRDIAGLLAGGEMDTRQGKEFVLYRDERLEVHADTNGSAGYCYVAAWLRTGSE